MDDNARIDRLARERVAKEKADVLSGQADEKRQRSERVDHLQTLIVESRDTATHAAAVLREAGDHLVELLRINEICIGWRGHERHRVIERGAWSIGAIHYEQPFDSRFSIPADTFHLLPDERIVHASSYSTGKVASAHSTFSIESLRRRIAEESKLTEERRRLILSVPPGKPAHMNEHLEITKLERDIRYYERLVGLLRVIQTPPHMPTTVRGPL